MAIKHTDVVVIPDDGSPVGSDDWNADHTIESGTITYSHLATGVARVLLSASVTFSINTTGSDITGSGTVANPWQTPQHAFDELVQKYDFGGFGVTVQAADGDYRSATGIGLQINESWIGGALTFQGNPTNRRAVTFGTSATNLVGLSIDNCTLNGFLRFNYIQITAPPGSAFDTVAANAGGNLFFTQCNVGGGGSNYDFSEFQSGLTVVLTGPYSIIDDPGIHVNLASGCAVKINGLVEAGLGGTGTITFGEFVLCTTQAFFDWGGSTSGTFVGQKFKAGPFAAVSGVGTMPGTTIGSIRQGGLVDDRFGIGKIGVGSGKLHLTGQSGGIVTLSTQNAAGTWTLTLPLTTGIAGNALITDGAGTTTWGYNDPLVMTERTTASLGTPATNTLVLFAQDSGAGKTQLCVLFPTGSATIIATEP